MTKVIYVTGAPAAGKSTTTAKLLEQLEAVDVWEYGARLTDHLRRKGVQVADQADLRSKSSRLAIADAIDELDGELLRFVAERRQSRHVLVDSHPVTREDYGFRITAFSHERFRQLSPDEIWVFYTSPEVTVERIRRDPGGRPQIDVETARLHTALQASVAATYGIAAGCPVYMFDTDTDQDGLVRELGMRLVE